MDKEKKLEHLEKIYDRQHYFIDRHDAMADKLTTALLVELTCLAIIFSICLEKVDLLNWYSYILFILFILFFTKCLYNLYQVSSPLSSKAKNENDISLLKEDDKAWIDDSIIYYRGIVERKEKSMNSKKVASQEYLNSIDVNPLIQDYIQQIFILAQYSNYKRKKLEETKKWIFATIIVGIVAALSIILTLLLPEISINTTEETVTIVLTKKLF